MSTPISKIRLNVLKILRSNVHFFAAQMSSFLPLFCTRNPLKCPPQVQYNTWGLQWAAIVWYAFEIKNIQIGPCYLIKHLKRKLKTDLHDFDIV
jgi:hypothetical protein